MSSRLVAPSRTVPSNPVNSPTQPNNANLQQLAAALNNGLAGGTKTQPTPRNSANFTNSPPPRPPGLKAGSIIGTLRESSNGNIGSGNAGDYSGVSFHSAAPGATAPTAPPAPHSQNQKFSSPKFPMSAPRVPSSVRPIALALNNAGTSEDQTLQSPNNILPASPSTPAVPQPAKEPPRELTEEEKSEKRERTRTKLATEIMNTEKSYVQSLNDLVDLYIQPLRILCKDPERSVVNDKDILTIFSNIEQITTLNANFLNDLTARISDWQPESCIADLFIQFAPFFKMYQVYVSNHDRATEVLKRLDNNEKFQCFVTKALTDPRAKHMSLASYLIMPIQRVPRYQLLLQELIRNTLDNHSDYLPLKSALAQVTSVAKAINEAVRMQENRLAIMSLQEQFTDSKISFVAPSRRFIRQGPLTKKCRASDKTYEFILFNDLLVYAAKTVTGKYKLHKQIDIDSIFNVEDLPADNAHQYQWQIINAAKSFIVSVGDLETKQAWLTDFIACITERAKAVGSSNNKHAAPVWQSDYSSKNCTICSKEFTTFNRRHHCRKCGGLVCDSCSRKRMVIGAKSGEKEKDSKKPQRVCDSCVSELNGGPSLKRRTAGSTIFSSQTVSAINNSASIGGYEPSTISQASIASNNNEDESDEDDDIQANLSSTPAPTADYIAPVNIIPSRPVPPIPQRPKDKPSIVKALFPYQAGAANDLTFEEGDFITVTKKDPSGWWVGTLQKDKTEGLFPSNYVIDIAEEARMQQSGVDANKVDMFVQATVSYSKVAEVEIDLVVGDVLHVYSKDGVMYYYGTHVKNGASGWLPQSCVKTISAAEATANSNNNQSNNNINGAGAFSEASPVVAFKSNSNSFAVNNKFSNLSVRPEESSPNASPRQSPAVSPKLGGAVAPFHNRGGSGVAAPPKSSNPSSAVSSAVSTPTHSSAPPPLLSKIQPSSFAISPPAKSTYSAINNNNNSTLNNISSSNNNSQSGGGAGKCSECDCPSFTAHMFQKTKCKVCFHPQFSHS
jgi:hypothetical protein